MEIAVVGAGAVGLSVATALVHSGADVACFEAGATVFGERSAGSSRIFRLAHAAPDLVRYAATALDAFDGWARHAGVPMVEPSGCVVSGGDAAVRARAMAAAGVPHELRDAPDERLGLPARRPASPVLVDPRGGVLDVDAVRRYLLAEAGHTVVHAPVRRVEAGSSGAVVVTPAGSRRVDAVVLAAGADTPGLAARVGIDLPHALEHHVRFSFPYAGPPGPAWIDHPDGGLPTYQHRTGPGRWSVGGSVDPALVAWENGRDAATAASERVVLDHVREWLTVEPTVVDRLYCTHAVRGSDGITFRRSGPVLAVHGENLMKFVPVLGETLAAAALDGSTPPDL